MSQQYTEYTVKGDKRWDTIAYEAYGDAGKVDPIIEANPTVAISAVVPAGTRLRIPIIETVEVTDDTDLLPPWKQ